MQKVAIRAVRKFFSFPWLFLLVVVADVQKSVNGDCLFLCPFPCGKFESVFLFLRIEEIPFLSPVRGKPFFSPFGRLRKRIETGFFRLAGRFMLGGNYVENPSFFTCIMNRIIFFPKENLSMKLL